MLISYEEISNELNKHKITLNGVLHIGSHECEEMNFYSRLNIKRENIIWIDGNQDKVDWAISRGIPNVYKAIITDVDDKILEFHISNNGQSSSILELGTHLKHHPHVHYVETREDRGITIDTFFSKNKLNSENCDLWNFDIQGAELMALKGALNSLKYPKAIYLEVNQEEVYKGGAMINDLDLFLEKYGFKRVLTKMTQYNWGDALYLKLQ